MYKPGCPILVLLVWGWPPATSEVQECVAPEGLPRVSLSGLSES